jgi:hypothetical protein
MYRAAPFYFVALLLLSVPAFWPTYFAPKVYEADWHVHLHGVAMFLWLAMLIGQAWLARARVFGAHRLVGKASYVLVPVIVASTLLLDSYRMRSGINAEFLYFFWVQLTLLVQFLVAYALAIHNRATPPIHMRFMACTALALVDPIVARLLYNHLGIEPPLMQLMTYGAVDVILLALILHDRAQRRDARVYAGMLAFFVATQVPTFVVTQSAWWNRFTHAFAALPLP